MATLDYLERTIGKPEVQKEEAGGTFRDYAVTSNIFGMTGYNPQTRLTETTIKDKWNPEEKRAIFETLTTPEQYDRLNSSVSKEHYDILEARNKINVEAEKRMANDNPVFRFGAQTVMGMADPTVVIPGTLAFKGSKAMTALKRIAYGGATGAAFATTQETILAEQTGREGETGSAAFWGATFGGGLFAIGPMIAGGKEVVSRAAAKAYTEPSIIEKFNRGELPDVEHKLGDDFFTYTAENGIKTKVSLSGVGMEPEPVWFEAPKMNKYISKLVISPVSRLARTAHEGFNRIGTMIQSSPIARMQGGRLFSEPENVMNIKQKLESGMGIANKEIKYAFFDAQKQGYTKNLDEYSVELNDILDDVIDRVYTKVHEGAAEELNILTQKQDLEIANLTAAYEQQLLTIKKSLMKAPEMKNLEVRQAKLEEVTKQVKSKLDEDIKKIKEQTEGFYQKKVNQLLDEESATFKLDDIDPIYHRGIKAYQQYNIDYHNRMVKLGMIDKEGTAPLFYKTRAWNLDALSNMSDTELRRRVSEGFYNDAFNKTMLKYNKMRKSTAEKRIDEIVAKLRNTELTRMMPDRTMIVPKSMPLGHFLKSKNYNLNDKYLGDLIDKDIPSIMQTYHQNMSGRVALHTKFGTDDLQVIQHEIVEPAAAQARKNGATEAEIASLIEDVNTLVEQVLGTHGLPQKPNAWGEKATNTLLKFNYLTFGGGFGINALADMGVVSFSVGLGNTMKHFAPALKAIRNMDEAAKDMPWIEQALGLGAASDFYNLRALTRFDDMDTAQATNRTMRTLDRWGNVMTKYSGLAPITAMEELMAIGGGTVDMIRTAQKFKQTGKLPHGFEEKLARYGMTKDDLLWVATQPVKIKNGVLIDFNWGEWTDKSKMEKFQIAITRTMNDAVIRGDKTLLPNYMTSSNPFMKLMTQFMRYPHIAYERVLLRGASKPTARFLSGTMTSAAIMASIYYIREQALISAGVLKERDAKFAIYDRFGNFDDDAMLRLSWTVASKLPQLGIAMDAVNKGIALAGKPTPGRLYDENPWTAIGGVTASRFDNITKGLDAAFDGKFTGMDAYYTAKPMIIFQNYLSIDQLYNPVAKELIEGR